MLGNIVERSSEAPRPPTAPRAPTESTSGFPTIVHRSQKPKRPSAFAAASARQARDTGVGRAVESTDIPKITASAVVSDGPAQAGPSKPRSGGKEAEYARMQQEIGDENRRKVEEMTFEEREEEVKDLEERFGSSVLLALRKRAEKRAGKAIEEGKSVRFDATATSPLGDADLKSTYFPNTAAEPDKLAWMSSSPIPATSSSANNGHFRFDLSGRLLSSSQQADLPTHLGLHHHGDQPDMAGYTLGEILHLCRSTVPAQRVGMMGLLAKVIGVHVLGDERESEEVRRICEEERVCEKAVSLAVDALYGGRSVTLLQTSIELLYTALGGPSWTLNETGPLAFLPGPDAGGRAAPVSSVPFEELLSRISELLITPDYLPSISIHHLTLILRRASTSSRETAETILPLLPPLLQTHVIRRPWPLQPGKAPLLEPLRLMRDLIASSRLCATEIVDAELPGSLLRFCVVSTWPEEDPLGIELCIEVVRIFGSLARYGLAAGTARTAHDMWAVQGEHVRSCLGSGDAQEVDLAAAYLALLEGWTTCAIDPHRTTPEHDLTWTQISGLGWAEEALDVLEKEVQKPRAETGVLRAAIDVLVAWLTGLGINGVKGGEEEKEAIRARLEESGLQAELWSILKSRREGKTGDQLLLSALRLQGALALAPTEEGQFAARFTLDNPEDHELLANLKPDGLGRSIQYELLRSSILLGSARGRSELQPAFSLLASFGPGEEPLALDLLDDLLKLDWLVTVPELASAVKGIGHADSITLLRPLLQHAILPDVTNITAPTHIHHLYLKATGTLRGPAPPSSDETGRLPPGLPLRPEWFFHPIDELLHSADSAALQQAPADWTPSELEIVRSTLVFLRLALACGYRLDRSALLFGMMKVYMLEHQTGGMVNTGESELFRDDVVKECLGNLLSGMTVGSGASPSSIPSSASAPRGGLETASTSFLGLEPFYQFYTDLVALFENASFGDSTFAQILLPPLSMRYPSDYRKVIWSNPNVLRLLRTSVKNVPLESPGGEDALRALYEPVENDPEVLSAYGQAVVRGWVKPNQEFMWGVAIYHLRAFFAQPDGGGQVETGGDKTVEQEKEVALARLRKGLRDAVMGSRNEAVIQALTKEGGVKPWSVV
ncbi:putative cytoplasm protein [Dioszegia hungarica]|uniref:Cytoplasm protein n=1 Tax=Dioszegia hungarica TaxID=4972 RepID=A0AA38H961_9TREE|nr:putative cytoplasm protein [Dioszegia hungarica]KAI9636872.1 putative cytoplasm protein [Dioszegia hungarica]